MTISLLLLLFISTSLLQFQANASPTVAIVKQLSSVVKWPRATVTKQSSSNAKSTHNIEANVIQFENGYFVETLVEGDKIGVTPYTVRVSPEGGELLAVDSAHGNIVRITAPLSEYSRGRLVAGSFQGHSGHVDGKPSDARFKHPKGVAVDDKGNVYVADTANLAIRKISEAGVTTIAGGKSNVPGYRDGPSEDAKFSTDFDVVYVKKTCSLLVVDRGNAALREIPLQQEDCNHQDNTVLSSDIVLVIGAVVAGYIFCLLQHGIGSSNSQKIHIPEAEQKQKNNNMEKPPLIVESLKEEPGAGWPSFGTLLTDLVKFAMEGVGNILLNSIPAGLRRGNGKSNLTPLKDKLVMPEDREETPIAQKLNTPPVRTETHHVANTSNEVTPKPQKSSKLTKHKDSSLSSKHRSSSKRPDYVEFYSSAEGPQPSSKNQKERVRHRHREKSGETIYGNAQPESKTAEVKSGEYSDPRFDHHYNVRSKYGNDNPYRY